MPRPTRLRGRRCPAGKAAPPERAEGRVLPAVFAAFLLFCLLAVLIQEAPAFRKTLDLNAVEAATGTPDRIGLLLMTNYLVPFEVISFLLLMALVGAATIARKELRDKE